MLKLGTTFLALSLLSLFSPAGCQSCSKKTPTAAETAPATATKPVEAAVENLSVASDKVEKKTDERDAAIKANVEHAQETAQALPESSEKTIITGDLSVVLNLLADVTADPAVKAQAARDALLVQAGRVTEANASYARSAEAGKKTAEELGKLKNDYNTMETSLTGQVAKLKETIKNNTAANQKVIDNALSEAQAAARAEQSRWLTLAAIVLVIAGLLLAYAKFNAGEPFKAAIVGGFFGGGALFCACLAYLLTEPWFQKFLKVTIISGTITGLLAFIAWLVVEWRSSKEKKVLAVERAQLDKDATEADSIVLKVYDTLEKKLSPEQLLALQMDFGNTFDSNEKAYVNELKAMRQRGTLFAAPKAA